MERKLMTVKQAREYMGLGRKKMYELVNSEGFPSFRIGKKIIVIREELDKWILEQLKKRG